LNDIVVS